VLHILTFEHPQPGFFSSFSELSSPARRNELLEADEEITFALFTSFLTTELIDTAEERWCRPEGITTISQFCAYLVNRIIGDSDQIWCQPATISTPEQLRIFLVRGGWESYREIIDGEQ